MTKNKKNMVELWEEKNGTTIDELFLNDLKTTREIGKMIGCSAQTIYVNLKKRGIDTKRHLSEYDKIKIKKNIDVHHLYNVENLKAREISEILGCSIRTVWKHLEKKGEEGC